MSASARRPSPARAEVVASFYLALTLVGLVWHATGQENNDVWRSTPGQGVGTLVSTAGVGLILGLGVVALFRMLEPHASWLPALHVEFRAILGQPSEREIFILAAASSIGEEVLFRGAMMDAWGVWWTTLIFALVHLPPRARLWPWTVSAGVLGLMLSALTLWTGNLGAAVAAHFIINFLNLGYITRREPRAA